jgi:hypothetical protein
VLLLLVGAVGADDAGLVAVELGDVDGGLVVDVPLAAVVVAGPHPPPLVAAGRVVARGPPARQRREAAAHLFAGRAALARTDQQPPELLLLGLAGIIIGWLEYDAGGWAGARARFIAGVGRLWRWGGVGGKKVRCARVQCTRGGSLSPALVQCRQSQRSRWRGVRASRAAPRSRSRSDDGAESGRIPPAQVGGRFGRWGWADSRARPTPHPPSHGKGAAAGWILQPQEDTSG